jgi:hypothetical protein
MQSFIGTMRKTAGVGGTLFLDRSGFKDNISPQGATPRSERTVQALGSPRLLDHSSESNTQSKSWIPHLVGGFNPSEKY